MDEAVCGYFGFLRDPFRPVICEEDFFGAPSRAQLIQDVVSGVINGRVKLTTIRGGRGAGKTSLMGVVAPQFHKLGLLTVAVGGIASDAYALQHLIGDAAGLPGVACDKPAEAFVDALSDEAHVRRLVLLCDNADTLSATVFSYFCRLMELFQASKMDIHLVLLGSQDSWVDARNPDLENTFERAPVRYVVFPMSDEESGAYLDYKFRHAGRSLRPHNARCGSATR
jgi:general secretion pathway protein A